MSVLLNTCKISVENPLSRISFETKGGGSWKVWDRFLFVDGRPAYHLGNICDTCEFFFEKQEGATGKVSLSRVSDVLRAGLKNLEVDFVQSVGSAVLPTGRYRVSLLQFAPEFVRPGEMSDYFAHEQLELWEADQVLGVPHNPKSEYYRGDSRFLGKNLSASYRPFNDCDQSSQLFEFIIPITNHRLLDHETVNFYRDRFVGGAESTALSISVLDIKGPATWEGTPAVNEHWCLAHYLLDGHHKIHAASLARKRITLLSFLDVSKGIASEKDEGLLFEKLLVT
jgi:hypothetical protein